MLKLYTGISVSVWEPYPDKLQELEQLCEEFLQFCRNEKIPVVVAAGNRPTTSDVNRNLPHKLSTPEDTMIIVGGVDEAGRVIPEMIDDSEGLVHVYSPGKNIETPVNGVSDELGLGTSQAAAIVVYVLLLYHDADTNFVQSGLIAYYNGLPNLDQGLAGANGGFLGAKGWVVSHAWPRSSPNSDINVVYNLARGDPVHSDLSCVQRRDRYGKRQDEGLCSLSSISATSLR